MRTLLLSIAILLLIVAFCAAVTVLDLKWIGEMEHLLADLEKREPSDAAKALDSLEMLFEKRRFLFSVSLPMEDVDSVKSALIFLKSAVENRDRAAYASGLCDLRFALYRMRDAAFPSLETIL